MKTIPVAFAALLFSNGAFASEAFDRYDDIRKDIISQRVSSETVEAAVDLFPDEDEFHSKLRRIVREAMTFRNRANRDLMFPLHQHAYFDFIRLPAHADVLLDFIETQHERLFVIPPKDANTYPGEKFAWAWSYIAEGAVFGYEATGNPRFVDLVVEGTQIALEHTDAALGIPDGFGREHLEGWSLEHGTPGREITLPGRILSPILHLAAVTENDESLEPESKGIIASLASRAVEILKPYLSEQIIEPDGRRYFHYNWTGEHDAINHMAAYAEACAWAYKVSGDTAFRDFAVGFRTYLLSVTTKDERGYYWPYTVLSDPEKQNDEALWKAAITIGGLLGMADAGISLSRPDQVGVVRSFQNYVIGPHRSVNAYLHPDRHFPLTGYNSYRAGYNGAGMFFYFVHLDKWYAGLRSLMLETIASRPDLFPYGLLMSPADASAYAHMLKNPMD